MTPLNSKLKAAAFLTLALMAASGHVTADALDDALQDLETARAERAQTEARLHATEAERAAALARERAREAEFARFEAENRADLAERARDEAEYRRWKMLRRPLGPDRLRYIERYEYRPHGSGYVERYEIVR